MEIYVDLVILLNCIVDFLLLVGTNRLTGYPPEPGRCALAGAVGGGYAGACMLPAFRFLGGTFWRLVFLGIMGAVAFGWSKSAWKRCGIFVLLNMALGGIALGLGSGGFWMPVLAAVGVWFLCRIGFGSTVVGQSYVPLEIRYGGKHLRLTALRDSGNTLTDPITGEPVLVIGADAARELTGLTERQLSAPLETLAGGAIAGLRLIPYRTVGRGGGFLLGLRLRDVMVGKRRMTVIVAFAPENMGAEGYQALTGGAV